MNLIKNSLNHIDRCFIIANGDSLNKMNLDLLKTEITIGSNYLYLLFNPTFLCISDSGLFNKMKKELEQIKTKFIFALAKDTINNLSKEMRSNAYILKNSMNSQKEWIDLLEIDSFDKDFQKTYRGHSVLRDLCFPLACFLGVKKIYIIGMDGFVNKEYKHFYKAGWLAHKEKDMSLYDKKIKELCKKEGINIYNCTLNTALNIFEKKDYLEVLNEL